jgi:hypothetical protein
MKNTNSNYSNISQKIETYLEKLQSNKKIIDFKFENQFQYNLIAIYILSEKNIIEKLNKLFFNEFSSLIGDTNLNVNILYSYIENNTLYDAEFLQGMKEIEKGYSVGAFGKYSDISDLPEDFYKIKSYD